MFLYINNFILYLIKILDKYKNIVYNIQVWNRRGFVRTNTILYIIREIGGREKEMSEVRVRENENTKNETE